MKKLSVTMAIWFTCLLPIRYVHAQQEQKIFPPLNESGNLHIPEIHTSDDTQHPISLYKFEYAAQFICGIQKDPLNTRLGKGCYITSVTIHNPNDTEVKYCKSLVLTYPPGEQEIGKAISMGEDVLRAGGAVEITGEDIKKELFPNGFPASCVKGLLIIRSMASLDVDALYETAIINNEGNIATLQDIEVKHVFERELKQRMLPDLIIRDFDRDQLNVDCYDWPETCVTRVTFTIENTGRINAGSFNVRVVFDPAQSVVVNQAVVGMDAGMSQVFTVKTPPGINCFDPDCAVCILVDSEDRVAELNEENNYRCINKAEKGEPKGK